MKSGLTTHALRFETASRLLETHKHHRMLDWPLWKWLRSDHLYTPSRWLDQTLRETLQMPFAEIAGARGIGAKKLEKLLTAIDRARNAIDGCVPAELGSISNAMGDDVHNGMEFPYRVACDAFFLGSKKAPIWDLDDRDWDFVTQLVRYHGLEDFMLGRFTSSLRELDRSLWHEKISTFTRRTFTQLGRMLGYGDVKIRQSVSQILRVAFILHALPEAHHEMRIALLPATIANANRWLTQLCYSEGQRLPDVHAVRKDFLQPLLTQLEKDTNARLVEVARRRIGVGPQQATLSEIGNDLGVTSDRIRTLILLVDISNWLHARAQGGRDMCQLAGMPWASGRQHRSRKRRVANCVRWCPPKLASYPDSPELRALSARRAADKKSNNGCYPYEQEQPIL